MPKTVSLRRSLFRNLASGPVVLGAVLLITSIFATRQLMTTIAAELTGRAIAEMDAALGAYLRPVEEIVDLSFEFGRAGRFQNLDQEELDHVFGPLLEAVDQVSSIHVARASGHEYMLLRQDDDYYNRLSGPEDTGFITVREWSGASTPGAPPPPARTPSDYDARDRPWFRHAIEALSDDPDLPVADQLVWSDPYTFFTTGEPGITASVAYRAPTGTVEVLAFDILLTAILDFARNIQVRNSGIVFVMLRHPREVEDLVVLAIPTERLASPGDAPPTFPIAVSALTGAPRELADIVFGTDAPAPGRPIRFDSDGVRWWGAAAIRPLSEERELWIGATIPEGEVLSGIPDTTSITLLALLVTVGGTVFRARWLARRYGEPIGELVAQTERIGRLNFTRETTIESSILEVQTLASSQEAMRRALAGLTGMNDRREIARELRRLPHPMRVTNAGGLQVAIWDEPAPQVGGNFPSCFAAGLSANGEWVLASPGRGSMAALVLVTTQLRDMSAAQHAAALRAIVHTSLQRGTGPGELIATLRGYLKSAAAVTAPSAVAALLVDGDSAKLDLTRDGDIFVLHFREPVTTAGTVAPHPTPRHTASAHQTLELRQGELVVLAPQSLFDITSRERRRLTAEDFENALQRLAERSPETVAAALARHVRDFVSGALLDVDITLVVIGHAAASEATERAESVAGR